MWAIIICFVQARDVSYLRHTTPLSPSSTPQQSLKQEGATCAQEVKKYCVDICEQLVTAQTKQEVACDTRCTPAERRLQFLDSGVWELDDLYRESLKLCKNNNTDWNKYKSPSLERKLVKATRGIAAAVKKCENLVGDFCVDTHMCSIFCKNAEIDCGDDCKKDKRCRAQAAKFVLDEAKPGKHDDIIPAVPVVRREQVQELENERRTMVGKKVVDFDRNEPLDIQTADQLMQCIAEEREKTVGKVTGRRLGQWRAVQTRGLQNLGVFTEMITKGYLQNPTEEDQDVIAGPR
eukprot:GEMP01045551.1.p1 GENE.GEMP01045551.1~~GEMP01045551.1.p1  ORF type:complete len:292 (+),score=50.35 GEMP01045551.1:217-1092(+)